MAFVFQIEALLSLKNAWLPSNVFFGYQGHLLSSAFLRIVLTAQKYSCINRHLTHRKPEYLEMRTTYAQ